MENDDFIYSLSERIAFIDLELHLEFLKEEKFKKRKKIIEDLLDDSNIKSEN